MDLEAYTKIERGAWPLVSRITGSYQFGCLSVAGTVWPDWRNEEWYSCGARGISRVARYVHWGLKIRV